MIGVHLMLDGVFEPPVGEDEITEILSGLPSEIDMKILAGPMVVRGAEENPGWTGFVIIDKSHIAIHIFDEGNRVSMDVFSCQPFEGERALGCIKERIRLNKYNTQIVERSEE
jgi:S-adenosylmethionine decarboxylase